VAEVDDELGEDAVSDAEVGLQLRADLETSESCVSRRIPSLTAPASVAAAIVARAARGWARGRVVLVLHGNGDGTVKGRRCGAATCGCQRRRPTRYTRCGSARAARRRPTLSDSSRSGTKHPRTVAHAHTHVRDPLAKVRRLTR